MKILAFIFTLLLSFTVLAKKPVLLLGVPHWPPYTIVEDDFIGGLDIDLFSVLSERLGYDLTLVSCPWKRCLRMIELGEIDVVSSMLKNAEREQFIDFVTPYYYQSNKVFYVLRTENIKLKRYDDLAKLLIGTTMGHSNDERFDKDESLNKVAMANEASLVDMLLKQRIDTFVSEERFADSVIVAKNLQKKVKKAEFMFAGAQGFLGVSKKTKHADLHNQLCQQVKSMLADGSLDSLFHQAATSVPRNYLSLERK
ncbi:extracellular solute-binding protein, putative [Pseudoalteromonas luteoviolacea B = ATCC 29581]|nr:extracellular solute-binding protein, putative [Pseudoalteromonas luteoviolacea B = ATCC 29581]